jgi:hypothetical protein
MDMGYGLQLEDALQAKIKQAIPQARRELQSPYLVPQKPAGENAVASCSQRSPLPV